MRGIVRPLELDLRARDLGELGLEPVDRRSGNGFVGANSSSRRSSSSAVPAAMITSPSSSTASGSGVVSKAPSRLRSATMIAPVCSRIAQVADRLAALRGTTA